MIILLHKGIIFNKGFQSQNVWRVFLAWAYFNCTSLKDYWN